MMKWWRQTHIQRARSSSPSPASMGGAVLSAEPLTEAFLVWCLGQGLNGPIDEDRLMILMVEFAMDNGYTPLSREAFCGALKKRGIKKAQRNAQYYERNFFQGLQRGQKQPRIWYWILPQRWIEDPEVVLRATVDLQLDLFKGVDESVGGKLDMSSSSQEREALGRGSESCTPSPHRQPGRKPARGCK